MFNAQIRSFMLFLLHKQLNDERVRANTHQGSNYGVELFIPVYRMIQDGLIDVVSDRYGRSYFKITPVGRAYLKQEIGV